MRYHCCNTRARTSRKRSVQASELFKLVHSLVFFWTGFKDGLMALVKGLPECRKSVPQEYFQADGGKFGSPFSYSS